MVKVLHYYQLCTAAVFCTTITQITQTCHTNAAWVKFFRKQLKGRKRWVIMSFSKQPEKKSQDPELERLACKSWLQLPCFILCDCAVCYAKFYQASTWTGPTWACLSSQTWRGAPLLHVGFPLLFFGNFPLVYIRSWYWYAYSGIYICRNKSP